MVWKKVGVVSVDSGTLLLSDPAYRKDLPSYEKITGLKKDKRVTGRLAEGDKTAEIKHKRGYAGAGVITDTGYGDGVYNVFANEVDEGKFGKRIAEVKVVFIQKRKLRSVS